jgi:glutamate/tyrosine decarboxylase-like PLP-dependent enzyme
MGLAMAREAKLSANESGLFGSRTAVVYASSEVHMSIPKSMALLGLGRASLRIVPVDGGFRMNVAELDRMVGEDQAAGKIPVAVVGSAGTVNTGAIDSFQDIAAVARRHQLWFHVDGAYGALAAIARPQLFAGLDAADSISLDPHKWLYQPVDCGCLLYRDPGAARSAFAYTGDYAKVLNADPVEGFAFFEESMELSRRFRALKLWLSLRYHGLSAFRESISSNLDLAQRLAVRISDHPKFELLAPVPLSAVCFRFKPDDLPKQDLNAFNANVLKRITQRGQIYLSNATVRGCFALRACITNHRTTAADVDAVVDEVIAAAKELA